MEIELFPEQDAFVFSNARITGAFSGKRGGKTEGGAVKIRRLIEEKYGWEDNGRDPYLAIIAAPNFPMLKRLSWKKFKAFADRSLYTENKQEMFMEWHNGAEVYGISGTRPENMEGMKANCVWIDEVFQFSENFFLEAMARVADQQGLIICTGSLGQNIVNPKNHWAYKYFKQNPATGTVTFEWPTAANPHFPKDELSRMKENLDPRTFRQMFEIDWDVPPTNMIYDTFCEHNVISAADFVMKDHYEISISVDWGWTNPMSVGFYAYDEITRTVYRFDEIYKSKLKLDVMWKMVLEKLEKWDVHQLTGKYCDIAGLQSREMVGSSNVAIMREDHGVDFDYKASKINKGISLVRKFIMDGKGRTRYKVVEENCPDHLDEMRGYCYHEVNGVLQEVPKPGINDHSLDEMRYYFINRHDDIANQPSMTEFNRWGKQWR